MQEHRRQENVNGACDILMRKLYIYIYMEMIDVFSSRVPLSRPGPIQLQVRTLYRHLIKNSSPYLWFIPMHWRNMLQTSNASKQINLISLL